jgi:RNA polymerase sigma-70 factor (ECF subfamily)
MNHVQPTDDDLRRLVEGCLRQDRRSQQRVYEMFFGKMLAVCMRYERDRDSAMDLVQEGFIKLFANMGKYKFDGSFEGWVRRIFVNNAIDSFRRKKHEFLVTEEDHVLARLSQEEDEIRVMEEEPEELNPQDVLKAMQQLTPAYRMVFNLYVMENYQHKDIADMLGINIGTSKSNLAKARINIRKILKKEFAHKFPD